MMVRDVRPDVATRGEASGRHRDRGMAVLRWLAWLLGLAATVWLVRRAGAAGVLEALRGAGPRLGWLVAAYAASTAVMALPWRWLLPAAARPALGGVVASRFAASGLNALLPLAGAGEVTRLLWLRPKDRPVGTAALITDRVVFALASVVVLIAGAAATLVLHGSPPALRSGVLLAALVMALLLAPVVGLARRGRAARGVERLVGWLGRRFGRGPGGGAPAGAAGVGAEIDAGLKRMFSAPRELALTLAAHLVARALAALEIAAALCALGVTPSLAQLLVLAAVPVALALVGALIPSQIGLQEGAQAAVAAAVGLGTTVGLTMVLLQRARQLLFVPITAVLLATRPRIHGDTAPGASVRQP
jgi:uncharacterized membrane protein YbhN (UPF0104 family)